MFVANGIFGDSRVIKTAQTVKKLGYRVTLFGIGSDSITRNVRHFSFPVTLLPSPKLPMIADGVWPGDVRDVDWDIYWDYVASDLLAALEELKPDIIHTHDMVGLAVGAKVHTRYRGNTLRWIHDIHEYVVGLTDIPEKQRNYYSSVEREYIKTPDCLTCVSPALSKILVDLHNLEEEPRLVLNVPRLSDYDPFYSSNVRQKLKVDNRQTLLTYIGNVKKIRGVDTIIEALPKTKNTSLAIITNSKNDYVSELKSSVSKLGVKNRVFFTPYVPFMNVTSFIRTASIGIHPIRRYPNSEIALPNKLFEYMHSGLPTIVSDSQTMSEFVDRHDCGSSFNQDSPEALAETINETSERLVNETNWCEQIRQLAKRYSWEKQEETILEIYNKLDGAKIETHKMANGKEPLRTIQLPAANAGQPSTISVAQRKLGHKASSLIVGNNKFGYDCDHYLSVADRNENGTNKLRHLLNEYDIFHYHGLPFLMNKRFSFPSGLDLLMVKAAGKKLFYHFRGSEIRMASAFQLVNPHNYVKENVTTFFKSFPENEQSRFADFVEGICDETFSVDPELQTYVPNSLVMPRVIDIEKWEYVGCKPEGRLKIVHAPSRRSYKGTDQIISAIQQLINEGYDIELVLVEKMKNHEAAELYRQADIIIDQLRIGWYGVLAVEAMALGKAVVAFIRDDLKHHLPFPCPLAIANPDNVVDVLRGLCNNPSQIETLGKRARAYAEQVHDAKKVSELLIHIYQNTSSVNISPIAISAWLSGQLQSDKKVTTNKARAKKTTVTITNRYLMLRELMTEHYPKRFLEVARNEGLKSALGKAYRVILG